MLFEFMASWRTWAGVLIKISTFIIAAATFVENYLAGTAPSANAVAGLIGMLSAGSTLTSAGQARDSTATVRKGADHA